jgi:hypothetical protein
MKSARSSITTAERIKHCASEPQTTAGATRYNSALSQIGVALAEPDSTVSVQACIGSAVQDQHTMNIFISFCSLPSDNQRQHRRKSKGGRALFEESLCFAGTGRIIWADSYLSARHPAILLRGLANIGQVEPQMLGDSGY